jgi:transcriptional regulator with XRE-family HTH domain
MSTQLNTNLLASMIKTKRGSKGLRKIAEEIEGVSASTLSRIEQGKVPDVDTFIKLCSWLGVSADTFSYHKSEEKKLDKQGIIAHLRAEKELDPDQVDIIVKMIDLAYNKT